MVRVEIQRLLGFKDASFDISTDLQLIAGPNNAGKSSLVNLLELFFSDPTEDMMVEHQPLNRYYSSEGPRTLSRITIHFGDLSSDEISIFAPIVRQRDTTFSVTLRASKTGRITFDASKKPGLEEARRYYEEVLRRVNFVKVPSIRMADGEFGDIDSLQRLLATLEAVLVRKGNYRSTVLQKKFSDQMEPVQELVQEVLDQSAEAIQSELPFQENRVNFRLPDSSHALRGMLAEAVLESEGEVSVPVARRGTGFQSALVLGILRLVASKEAQSGGNILFAIEEPEAFLHPQTQRAMAKIIRGISSTAQVLVTTHSAVLVDSFSVDQIIRLPLQPTGLEFAWTPPALEEADVGRLTRYCSANNSELVFATAVVFVEGESDAATVQKLLEGLCGGPGGQFALGLTVIDSGGITKVQHLLELAQLFGVRSYVLADKDSLVKGSGDRPLLQALKVRRTPPDSATAAAIRSVADRKVRNLKEALAVQTELNSWLEPFDAFVLASDLEGLLLDLYGFPELVKALGPSGHEAIDQAFVDLLVTVPDGVERLASWLGTKGWNSNAKTSQKLPPHLPSLLVAEWMEAHPTRRRVIKPLIDWLASIVSAATHAPL